MQDSIVFDPLVPSQTVRKRPTEMSQQAALPAVVTEVALPKVMMLAGELSASVATAAKRKAREVAVEAIADAEQGIDRMITMAGTIKRRMIMDADAGGLGIAEDDARPELVAQYAQFATQIFQNVQGDMRRLTGRVAGASSSAELALTY